MSQSHYNKVKDWMTKFGQATPNKPAIPEFAVRKLRAKLILEEALETIYALGFVASIEGDTDTIQPDLTNVYFDELLEPNLIEVVDGLCDLHYVAFCGTAIALGLNEAQMNASFEEVHRSNMSKLWTDNEVQYAGFILAIEFDYKQGWNSSANLFCKQVGVRWLVTDSHGKVVKSPSYSPANLKPILEQ